MTPTPTPLRPTDRLLIALRLLMLARGVVR